MVRLQVGAALMVILAGCTSAPADPASGLSEEPTSEPSATLERDFDSMSVFALRIPGLGPFVSGQNCIRLENAYVEQVAATFVLGAEASPGLLGRVTLDGDELSSAALGPGETVVEHSGEPKVGTLVIHAVLDETAMLADEDFQISLMLQHGTSAAPIAERLTCG